MLPNMMRRNAATQCMQRLGVDMDITFPQPSGVHRGLALLLLLAAPLCGLKFRRSLSP